MGRLDKKVAIITGGGSGLGQVTAKLFAEEKAKVVVADYSADAGKGTVKAIQDAGGEAYFIATDVSKSADVDRLIKETVKKYGRLDIMINCAGIAPEEISTVDCPEELFDKIVAINLKGTWLGMKYSIPAMIKSGGGAIVNFASIAAMEGYKKLPTYSATKGGVVSLSRVAAYENAANNIRVNCVAPGTIGTPLLLSCWSEEALNSFRRGTPQGRLGEPIEVARAVLFLASSDASHITGHTLVVDGGSTARVPFQ
jgi:NAD(P)-dependent dehydrogenase (short-subunit alcohol dehydrogenase family)